ncbi:hypothetical protein PMI08_00314 [Brevibacillus sp. CF112]|nr:hypothetical protein PMI08_00314 [Brevibacillus sp. CF112]
MQSGEYQVNVAVNKADRIRVHRIPLGRCAKINHFTVNPRSNPHGDEVQHRKNPHPYSRLLLRQGSGNRICQRNLHERLAHIAKDQKAGNPDDCYARKSREQSKADQQQAGRQKKQVRVPFPVCELPAHSAGTMTKPIQFVDSSCTDESSSGLT